MDHLTYLRLQRQRRFYMKELRQWNAEEIDELYELLAQNADAINLALATSRA